MPGRKVPLVNNQVYHVINRGVASQPIFNNKRDYRRAFETLIYYRHIKPPMRYSYFINLPKDRKEEILKLISEDKKCLVQIIAYCLMPNHVHLLLKQTDNKGISIFMSRYANSYTKYFNTRHERSGPLFQGKFKAVRVETDEQLIHVSRYIHLNPYTSFIVGDVNEIENYEFSSFREYLSSPDGVCQKGLVLNLFKDNSDYKKFVLDQADYQRNMGSMKNLMLEK